MSRFEISSEGIASRNLVLLTDSVTRASARVWTEYGNNCVSLSLPNPAKPAGPLISLIDDAGDLDDLHEFPSRYGTPILFPWPGAIPEGKYSFGGEHYQVQRIDFNNCSYHGFVRDRAWHIESTEATDEFAELRCSISGADYAEAYGSYPFDNVLTITHRLDKSGLTMAAEVINRGNRPMPFGLGFHPYFKVPFAAGGARDRTIVNIGAEGQWDFDAIGKIRPGELSGAGSARVRKPSSYSGAIELGDSNFNEGFTQLLTAGKTTEAQVIDPDSRIVGVMQCSDNFRTLVFYTPQTRPCVCVEPWTCTSNAFNLAAAGIEDSGLIVLAPSQRWQGWMRMFVMNA